MPIGNLTSQLFANVYLNELDKYIKYELKIRYYIRYMDDFIIIDISKEFLHDVKNKIKVFLESMALICHSKKTNISPLNLGVDFLGYRIFETHNLARKSTVKRFIRISKKKIGLYEQGYISHDKLMESFNSWEAYMNHGNTYSLKNDLYRRYFKNVA